MSRDGRAVARSLLAVDWWPDTDIWWWGGTPRDWAREGGDPLELAAKHWVHEVEAIEEGLAGISSRRVLRVSYEALVRSPHRRAHRDRRLRRPRRRPRVAGRAGHGALPRQEPAGPGSRARPPRGEIQAAHAATMRCSARVPGMTRPVFVLGTGRCGSTLVHEVLARHEGTGFMTNLDDLNLSRSSAWQNTVWRRLPPG